MRHISTRGKISNLSFEEAVMMGLADDGGLLIPKEFPQIQKYLEKWRGYSFVELSIAIISQYIDGELPDADIEMIIKKSYSTFSNKEITPIVSVGNLNVVELFHGPTFAFKDIALQFLGNLFEYFLQKRGHYLTILGATSGDTGSAAIYGLRGKKNVNLFMLHPKGRVSKVQEYQMTTVLDDNIHNVAVEGTFDDAQTIVKALFNDLEFKQKYHLGAVNSINWARILAQIVYYFYSYFRVTSSNAELVNFSVPTGNFGDILAGYYAKKMGLPIEKLVVATNQNDILDRFFNQGEYVKKTVIPSLSPSMDIQISSNFERYLYDLGGKNSIQLNAWMKSFHETGRIKIDENLLKQAQSEIVSKSVTEEETLETIQEYYEKFNYLLDPHTAVGVKASCEISNEIPLICLATAHPAKFSTAINKAIGTDPDIPSTLQSLESQKTRCETVAANKEDVRNLMNKHLN